MLFKIAHSLSSACTRTRAQVHRLVPLVYLAALALTAARAQAGAAGGGGSGGNSSSTPLLLTGAGQWYLCSFPLLDLLTNLLNPVGGGRGGRVISTSPN